MIQVFLVLLVIFIVSVLFFLIEIQQLKTKLNIINSNLDKLVLNGDEIDEENIDDILSPANMFKTENEVIDFIRYCDDIRALQAFRQRCEAQELYSFCKIIKEKEDKLKSIKK